MILIQDQVIYFLLLSIDFNIKVFNNINWKSRIFAPDGSIIYFDNNTNVNISFIGQTYKVYFII